MRALNPSRRPSADRRRTVRAQRLRPTPSRAKRAARSSVRRATAGRSPQSDGGGGCGQPAIELYAASHRRAPQPRRCEGSGPASTDPRQEPAVAPLRGPEICREESSTDPPALRARLRGADDRVAVGRRTRTPSEEIPRVSDQNQRWRFVATSDIATANRQSFGSRLPVFTGSVRHWCSRPEEYIPKAFEAKPQALRTR